MYYSGTPIVEDALYDTLEKSYLHDNPNDLLPIEFVETENVKRVRPHLSLKKLTTKDIEKLPYTEISGFPKVDGLSMELIFYYGNLIQARTRGGFDKTDNVKSLLGWSHVQNLENIPEVIVRGEIVIDKKLFDEKLADKFSNPRNTISGSVNSKGDFSEELKGAASFIVWEVLKHSKNFDRHSEALDEMRKSFSVVDLLGVFTRKEDLVKQLEEFENDKEKVKDAFAYQIDGLVLYNNYIPSWIDDTDSQSTYNNAVAWKFSNEKEWTTVEAIEWSRGLSGVITPVMKVKPINLGGVTVTSVNLFNKELLLKKNVKIGSLVCVERAGDVIPHISTEAIDTENSEELFIPDTCPVCSDTLTESGKQIMCVNPFCGDAFSSLILRWSNKHDCKFLGEEACVVLKEIYEKENVQENPLMWLYDITPSTLTPYWTEGKIKRLFVNLEEARKLSTPSKVMSSFNIRLVGERTVDNVLRKHKIAFNELESLKLDNTSLVVEFNVVNWIKENKELFHKICERFPSYRQEEVKSTKHVVVTGSVSGLSRKEVKNKLESLGFSMKDTVTKETTCLISESTETSSSKYKKALEIGVPVYTFMRFLDTMVENG